MRAASGEANRRSSSEIRRPRGLEAFAEKRQLSLKPDFSLVVPKNLHINTDLVYFYILL